MKCAKNKILLFFIYIIPIIMIFISLFIGRYHVSFSNVIKIVLKNTTNLNFNIDDIANTVVWNIRLPRAILGALVGGSLAISGAAFQGMFKNPLVDTGILGVSTGASLGAIVAIIMFDNNYLLVYFFAFIFGILAVLLSYLIGSIYKSTPAIMLVLGGVIVSSLFSSLVSLGKYIADPYDQLPTITFWLMGSLANASFLDILYIIVPVMIGGIGIYLIRWRINVLSMGDKEAQSLGINVKLTKAIVICFATLATASAVCVSGTIGWIGLVIPHIGRMLYGNDNKILIPISFTLGATFLVLIDNIARTITGAEIPIGVLTSLIGAPFYVFLLKKTKGGGW